MTEHDIRERADFVISTLEKSKSDVLSHFVAFQTVSLALASLGKMSPIVGVDPITMSLVREIENILPDISVIDATLVRAEISRQIAESDLADSFFERQNI